MLTSLEIDVLVHLNNLKNTIYSAERKIRSKFHFNSYEEFLDYFRLNPNVRDAIGRPQLTIIARDKFFSHATPSFVYELLKADLFE